MDELGRDESAELTSDMYRTVQERGSNWRKYFNPLPPEGFTPGSALRLDAYARLEELEREIWAMEDLEKGR